MKDTQRKKAYDWEDSWEYSSLRGMSETGLRHWVRWACKQYGVKPPKVKLHWRVTGGTSFYWGETDTIEFRKRHANVWTALHEASHKIADELLGEHLEPHSPHWLGIFMALLVKAGYAPRKALEASADAAGLKYVSPAKIGPRKIRKHYRSAARKRRHY